MSPTKCIITHCGSTIIAGKILCQRHWEILPWNIKKRLLDSLPTPNTIPSILFVEIRRQALLYISKQEGGRDVG